jgi:hypothetical protein
MPDETAFTYDYTSSATTAEETGDGSRLTFPSDLDHYGHWVVFSSFKYSRENRMTPDARKGKYLGHIVLPRPRNLDTNYTVNHEQNDLGLGIAAVGAANVLKKGMGTYSDKKLTISQKNNELARLMENAMGDAVPNMPGLGAGLMLDTFGDVSRGLSLATGLARNPHMSVIFKSVNLRQHQFDYDFVCRNQQESETLFRIIYFLKNSMHPSYADGFHNHLFEYPDEFEISFDRSDYMYSFGPCVLTNVSVNYHNAGSPAYFQNTHAPVAVGLSLSFLETTIVTKETISGYNR